jgi:hypothetical protein
MEMNTRPDRVEAVAALLHEAEAAHGTYEANELGGVYDQEWPAWYARRVVDHGLADVLGREISTDSLTDLLRRSFQDFKALDPSAAGTWGTYTAGRIVDDL